MNKNKNNIDIFNLKTKNEIEEYYKKYMKYSNSTEKIQVLKNHTNKELKHIYTILYVYYKGFSSKEHNLDWITQYFDNLQRAEAISRYVKIK